MKTTTGHKSTCFTNEVFDYEQAIHELLKYAVRQEGDNNVIVTVNLDSDYVESLIRKINSTVSNITIIESDSLGLPGVVNVIGNFANRADSFTILEPMLTCGEVRSLEDFLNDSEIKCPVAYSAQIESKYHNDLYIEYGIELIELSSQLRLNNGKDTTLHLVYSDVAERAVSELLHTMDNSVKSKMLITCSNSRVAIQALILKENVDINPDVVYHAGTVEEVHQLLLQVNGKYEEVYILDPLSIFINAKAIEVALMSHTDKAFYYNAVVSNSNDLIEFMNNNIVELLPAYNKLSSEYLGGNTLETDIEDYIHCLHSKQVLTKQSFHKNFDLVVGIVANILYVENKLKDKAAINDPIFLDALADIVMTVRDRII